MYDEVLLLLYLKTVWSMVIGADVLPVDLGLISAIQHVVFWLKGVVLQGQ